MDLAATLFGGVFTLAAAYGLGSAALRRTGMPREIRLAVGAAIASLIVFLILLCQVASWPVFLGLGVCSIALWKWRGTAAHCEAAIEPLSPFGRAAAWAIFAAYGIFYLVNALAPEVQADGVTYHLGLPHEYLRVGGFPAHVRFYDLIPQGMEMLFTMAFAFGRHAAAKLVEFGLYAAGVPLIFRIGRRFGWRDSATLVAAVFYWSAPVFGITGSSSYNDAAEVFFTLAALYVLLVWRDTRDARLLAVAGALAGFCYAIKFPGAFAIAGALIFVIVYERSRRVKCLALFSLGVALTVSPWMARSGVLTGNPLAPLRNDLFPNPHFHLATERDLSDGMRSLHGVAPRDVPWELAFGDRLNGTFGPLLLLVPLAIFAVRRPSGRICLIGAIVLAVPWWNNTGARFLMPAAMLAIMALASLLPRKLAWAAIALQALAAWPPVLNAWQPPYIFRVHELPWRAALGIEREADYLPAHILEFNVAKMVERSTPPDARIYSLIPVPSAYLARDVAVYWQSAEADQLIDTMRVAAKFQEDPLYNWTAAWPLISLRALRFRMGGSYAGEWDIDEVQLFSSGDRIFNSPSWTLRAWPNVWEAPLAFDNRRSTRWRTWQPVRRGMYVEIDLDHPQRLSSAELVTHTEQYAAPLEFYGQGSDGRWRLLSNRPAVERRPAEDLRIEATSVIRHAGFQYLLAPLDAGGNGPLGRQLLAEAAAWGLEVAGVAGPYVLFKVR